MVEQDGLYGAVIDSAAEISAVRPTCVHTEIAVHGEVFGKTTSEASGILNVTACELL